MADDRTMGVLRRSADVLQLVASRGALSVAEVADQVDLPRATIYRLTEALAQARLINLAQDGKVRASLRLVRLGDAARAARADWSSARQTLDSLSDQTGQTTYLTVPQGDAALCIDWSRGRGLSVLALKPGRMLPLYAGAAGRVTLAFRSEPLSDYLRLAPFTALTPATLTTAEQLESDVAAIQSRGFSISDEDVTVGIGALGVPLRSSGGDFLGALSLAGLADDLRNEQTALVEALVESARQLVSAD